MLLSVEHVSKSFSHKHAFSASHRHLIIDDVSFQLAQGESIGLLGESGSGKSTLANLICGLEYPDSGQILINGQSTTDKKSGKKPLSIVFQDYTTSINPTMNVKQVIAESLLLGGYIPRAQLQDQVSALLDRVGLSPKLMNRYIHELSGGQAQRVCISRALATCPSLIVLDEPVSSLDVPTQVKILDLLEKLKDDLQLSYFFITHDLQLVCYFCESVLFFQQKTIVERCQTADIAKVKHPYAQSLLNAVI
ncbi:nickel transport system ATP-binding protein [Orbus hercynius]|uniref:Nickel transport system ATP-binding protein n=1 Tax=Orbus hercynius TaxID=593135 RepID=A0A495RJF8_9GAMM|nr:ABC transporter ATP-binding protein [Orbus hercynius]RKS87434.1 nickel transport system ATP-binding protein [Orbus hercynius]